MSSAASPSATRVTLLGTGSPLPTAAQTAERAGVSTFLPTHFLPAIAPGDEDTWRKLAAAHFSGEIVFGGDLTALSVAQHAGRPG